MEIPAGVNIPTSFYIMVGALVIANIGTLGAFVTFIFKAGMFVATTKAGIKDAKETAVRAHLRIDDLKKGVDA